MQRRGRDWPIDVNAVSLPADFILWLASPEAAFLKGRYVWANWDVEEMLAKKEEIEADPKLLTMMLEGLRTEW